MEFQFLEVPFNDNRLSHTGTTLKHINEQDELPSLKAKSQTDLHGEAHGERRSLDGDKEVGSFWRIGAHCLANLIHSLPVDVVRATLREISLRLEALETLNY